MENENKRNLNDLVKKYVYFSLDGSGNIEQIDDSEVKLNRPTVLIFGGSGTDREVFVNLYLKSASSLLGVFNSDAQCIGINYNKLNIDDETRHFSLKKLSTQLLLPLLENDGKKIEVERACKNLRNITLLSHCLGHSWVNELVQILTVQMEELGYSEPERNKILEQLFQVSYGVNAENSLVKTLNVISPYDDIWESAAKPWYNLLSNPDSAKMSPSDRQKMETFGSEFLYKTNGKKRLYYDISDRIKGQFVSDLSRVFAVKNGNEITLVASQLSRDDYEHPLKILDRTPDWQARGQLTPAGDTVSKIMGAAICNSVANAIQNSTSQQLIPFSFDELFEQVQEIAVKFNESQELSGNGFSRE